MKMKKRAASLVLAIIMGTSIMTGCGKNAPEGAKEMDASASSKEATQEDGVKELDLYMNFAWFPTDSWTGIIPDELTKNGGVKFNVTRAADESQLGLLIASGDLPDVIFTDSEMDRLSTSEVCWSYDELIEKYNIDWKPSEDRVSIAKARNMNPEDDHYYTIIQNYNSNEEWSEASNVAPSMAGLYYRKDIWEKIGSPSMNSMEEIKNVMQLVKEKYPEMDPLNAGMHSWRFKVFKEWSGVAFDFLYNEEGILSYADTTDSFYNYSKYVNELYRDSLFQEENLAITNDDDAMQQAYRGQSFFFEWNARPMRLEQLNTETQKNVPGAEWGFVAVPDATSTITRSNAGWAGVYISKNCKDPEAAIKMISYMNSEEAQRLALWGRKDVDYTQEENGTLKFSDEWMEAQKDSNVMTEKYNNNYYMCTTELDEVRSFFANIDPEICASFTKNSDKYVNRPELSIALPVSGSEEGIVYSKIKEARNAEYVKLYTAKNEKDFEKAYETYMELLKKIGVDQLDAYMNQNVLEVKEKFNF